MEEYIDKSKRGMEYLNISVDIGHGQKDNLLVCENDNLELIVRLFFIKNGISNRSDQALLRKVQELYEEVAEEYRLISQAVAFTPNYPKTSYKNYGEKLYLEGLQAKEEFLIDNQIKRIQNAKEIEKTVKPYPKIDKKSVKIVEKLRSRPNSMYITTSLKSLVTEPSSTPRKSVNSKKTFNNSIKKFDAFQTYQSLKSPEKTSPVKKPKKPLRNYKEVTVKLKG